jgi:recombination DNA repair RAD52 pathway protein
MGLSRSQWETLSRPVNSTRIAQRSQGGKTLSYLEAFDVRAHLIRIFGYTNFDLELLDYSHVGTREYTTPPRNDQDTPKSMVEVIYTARVRLTLRDPDGQVLCTYVEGAGGSASGPLGMLGEHHDNALKTAESDALKRCAINLGNQFGLSLYDNGSTRDVVKRTLVNPYAEDQTQITDGNGKVIATVAADTSLNEEQVQVLRDSLGAVFVPPEGTQTPEASSPQPGQEPARGEEAASPVGSPA